MALVPWHTRYVKVMAFSSSKNDEGAVHDNAHLAIVARSMTDEPAEMANIAPMLEPVSANVAATPE